jgi:ribonuclease R
VATDLLEHLRKLPHGRATLKQLLREMSRGGVTRAALEADLQKMADRGQIIETRPGYYAVAGVNREFAAGRLNVHRDGYAFLIPDLPVPGLRGDVYVPKEAAIRAMHGDRVIVHIGRIESDGRAHGEIVRVLRRAHPQVVGEFRVRRNGCFVVPHDSRIRQWIEIPEELAIPPVHAAVDRVGVSEVQIKSVADLDGMIVTAEIFDFGVSEAGGTTSGHRAA